ncbi:hypothetical protein DK419_22785 [Methylobacterium terrae]|uniref:Uncharacterized protein n=1 Tax=Methylobacterium terrae TaxID=2202827 RepID=A0A2U8WTJ8_9HYPH|nr:hypothetical protein [Methylobacterium terrae]AWN48828.1 hypothetical protein DK419_22785 [Methylobacterium terrae]
MRSARLSVPLALGLLVGPLVGPLAASPSSARAEGPPTFSLAKACALEDRPGPYASRASERGCLADERAARRTLRRLWPTYPASDRGNCRAESEIGGTPSYVALLTCLQLEDGTLPREPPPLSQVR